MKNNLNNDPNSWQERLKQYEFTATTSIDMEASWKKLRQRLDDAPKRNKAWWYWAAAASVVLFFAVKAYYSYEGSHTVPKSIVNRKLPAVHDNKIQLPDPVTPEEKMSTALMTGKSKNRTQAGKNQDTLRALTSKKIPIPLLQDGTKNVVNDSLVGQPDIVQESTPLPTFHINDISTREPLPAGVSMKSLSIKKLIRLFGTDMTSGQPIKETKKIPNNQSIPNNQN